jgi:hypothetical protein
MEVQFKLFKTFIACFLLYASLYGDVQDRGVKNKLYVMQGKNYISNEDYSFRKIYLSNKTNIKDILKFNFFYACVNNDESNIDSECKVLTNTNKLVVSNFFLTIGKDFVVWGRGMFFSPINYFNRITFENKFIDKDIPIEGIDLLKMQVIWEIISFESIYTFDKKEYGNRLSFFIDNISFSLSSLYKSKTKQNFLGLDFQIPFSSYTFYIEKTYIDDNQYTVGLDKDINNVFELFKIGVEFYKRQNDKNIVFYTFIEENNFNFIYSLSKNTNYDKYEMTTNIKYSFSSNLSLSLSNNSQFQKEKNSNNFFSYSFIYAKDIE